MSSTLETVPRRLRMTNARALALLTFVAIGLRFLMFAGRGDYVAFDEGWYLLLARNLVAGEGYSLAGLRHTVLSPLFPVLAGAASIITGDIIWAGRAVAAICAGLLVLPCWFLFRRLAGVRTAWIGCLIIIAVPTLAPFTVPFWIDWDLWVGAEPVLHLFLYGGLALALRAYDTGKPWDWALAGLSFTLAYLARPEASLVLGVLGMVLGLHSILTRAPRRLVGAAVLGIAFCAGALPYWVYLHDTLGRWTISGRGVQVSTSAATAASNSERGAAGTIEKMLWGESQRAYVQVLYGLDRSGTRLRSSYWGVATDSAVPALPSQAPVGAGIGQAPAAAPDTAARPQSQVIQNHWILYGRGLVRAVPWYLLGIAVVGLIWSGGRGIGQCLVAVPLAVTSLAIALVVGVDPRTQLFLAPIAAYYAARAIISATSALESKPNVSLRPQFMRALFTGLLILALITVQGRWLFLSLSVPSPHHRVGTANRTIGTALRTITAPDEPLMSWHPAVALYANRDWRVLPYAPFEAIVGYASAINCGSVVFSAFYPGSQFIRGLPREHLVLTVPTGVTATDSMRVEITGSAETHISGRLRVAGDGGA